MSVDFLYPFLGEKNCTLAAEKVVDYADTLSAYYADMAMTMRTLTTNFEGLSLILKSLTTQTGEFQTS